MTYNKRQTTASKERRRRSKRQPAETKGQMPFSYLAAATSDQQDQQRESRDLPSPSVGLRRLSTTPDSHALFSPDAWNPHTILSGALTPARGVSGPAVPQGLADDDMFLTSLFDDVLNDAEHFIAGMSVPDPNVLVSLPSPSPFGPSFDVKVDKFNKVDKVDKGLQPFDMDNVSYVGSPDVREMVRKYPSKKKQGLDSKGVVEFTKTTMTQQAITTEDIKHAKKEMARMLRSFDLNAAGDVPMVTGGDAKPTICRNTRSKANNTNTTINAKDTNNANNTNNTNSANTMNTMNAVTPIGDNYKTAKTPRASPGLPQFPHPAKSLATMTSSLLSPSTLDTFTHHQDDWLETMLLTTSPATASLLTTSGSLAQLSDVRLLSPTDLGLPHLPDDLSI